MRHPIDLGMEFMLVTLHVKAWSEDIDFGALYAVTKQHQEVVGASVLALEAQESALKKSIAALENQLLVITEQTKYLASASTEVRSAFKQLENVPYVIRIAVMQDVRDAINAAAASSIGQAIESQADAITDKSKRNVEAAAAALIDAMSKARADVADIKKSSESLAASAKKADWWVWGAVFFGGLIFGQLLIALVVAVRG